MPPSEKTISMDRLSEETCFLCGKETSHRHIVEMTASPDRLRFVDLPDLLARWDGMEARLSQDTRVDAGPLPPTSQSKISELLEGLEREGIPTAWELRDAYTPLQLAVLAADSLAECLRLRAGIKQARDIADNGYCCDECNPSLDSLVDVLGELL